MDNCTMRSAGRLNDKKKEIGRTSADVHMLFFIDFV